MFKVPVFDPFNKKRGITQVEEDKSLILRQLNLYPDVFGLQELMDAIKATFTAQT